MTEIAKATVEDFAALNADLRDMDRAECRVFGQDGEDFSAYEQAYAIRIGGDLVGIAGWATFDGDTPIADRRLLLFMTTNAVWKHKVEFVKRSRVVFEWLTARLPVWVRDIFAVPMSEYAASINWQKRMLGFKETDKQVLNGVEHTILHVTRKVV